MSKLNTWQTNLVWMVLNQDQTLPILYWSPKLALRRTTHQPPMLLQLKKSAKTEKWLSQPRPKKNCKTMEQSPKTRSQPNRLNKLRRKKRRHQNLLPKSKSKWTWTKLLRKCLTRPFKEILRAALIVLSWARRLLRVRSWLTCLIMMAMLCKLRSMVAMKMLLKAGLRELSTHTSRALDYHE